MDYTLTDGGNVMIEYSDYKPQNFTGIKFENGMNSLFVKANEWFRNTDLKLEQFSMTQLENNNLKKGLIALINLIGQKTDVHPSTKDITVTVYKNDKKIESLSFLYDSSTIDTAAQMLMFVLYALNHYNTIKIFIVDHTVATQDAKHALNVITNVPKLKKTEQIYYMPDQMEYPTDETMDYKIPLLYSPMYNLYMHYRYLLTAFNLDNLFGLVFDPMTGTCYYGCPLVTKNEVSIVNDKKPGSKITIVTPG